MTNSFFHNFNASNIQGLSFHLTVGSILPLRSNHDILFSFLSLSRTRHSANTSWMNEWMKKMRDHTLCLFIFFTVFFDPKEVGCVQIKSFGPKSHLLKGNYTVWNYIFWAWTYEENKFLKPSRHEVFLKIRCWLSSSLTPNAF